MEKFLIEYEQLVIWLIAALLFVLFAVPFWIKKVRLERHTTVQNRLAVEYGLNEPVSLYPRVNPEICIGSAGCVAACPEEDVLGIRNGQGVAVNKANCIGHGLCERACPVDAITLVFGSKTRGVDIPRIRENFETNVDGLFIVGELGGMGLIQNAFEQARQCVGYMQRAVKPSGGAGARSSSASAKSSEAGARSSGTDGGDTGVAFAKEDVYDLIIIGCGPAGLSASIHAKQAGYRFKTLEREGVGGAVLSYPRKKLVLTQPIKLPGIGKIHKKQMLKEELLELWESLVEQHDLGDDIEMGVSVDEIRSAEHGFDLVAGGQIWRSRQVLIAIGRRGTPRKLGIPGEDLDNVAYSLLEPDHYQDERIMVVGGGDSAIEAAVTLSEQPGNQVSVSYRRSKFNRLKPLNRMKLKEASEAGRLTLYLETNVTENRKDAVVLKGTSGNEQVLPNDSLFVFAGGILPTAFLEKAGIKIDTKFGEP